MEEDTGLDLGVEVEQETEVLVVVTERMQQLEQDQEAEETVEMVGRVYLFCSFRRRALQ